MYNANAYNQSIYQVNAMTQEEIRERAIAMAKESIRYKAPELPDIVQTLLELSVGELEIIQASLKTKSFEAIGAVVYDAIVESQADEFETRITGIS